MNKLKIVKHKGNDDIMELFNQMTGVKDADPTIIEGKYENMLDLMTKIIGVWDIFISSEFGKFLKTDMTKAYDDIHKFVTEGRIFLNECKLKEDPNKMKTDFSPNIFDDIYELGTKYNAKELNETYRRMKNSEIMNHVVVTLKNMKMLLDDEKKRSGSVFGCLDIPEALSNAFIKKAVNDTTMLSFSVLNFKFVYTIFEKDEEKFNKLVLFSLYITYLNCSRLYKIFTTPDIDIKKFVQAFKEKLKEMKKTIGGCDGAFKCLSQSLKLLESNFEEYYHDFMVTGNPGIIFEKYIDDVKKKNENNIAVLMQFKKLIAYIRDKIPKEMLQNPSVQKLWSMSEKIFKKAEDD